MNSYLDQLRAIQCPHFSSVADSYEQYLHRGSRKSKQLHLNRRNEEILSQDCYQIRHLRTSDNLALEKQCEKICKNSFGHCQQTVCRLCLGSNLSVNTPQKKVQYIPFQRKVIDYVDQEIRQKVPVKRQIVELQEKKVKQYIPKQITVTDYYSIQHIKKYLKQVVPEVKVEIKQVPKVVKKVEYVPVKKQVVYFPTLGQDQVMQRMKAREYLKQQGILFDKDTEFLPMADRFTGENGINDRVSNGIVFKPTEFTSEQERFMSPLQPTEQIPYYDSRKYPLTPKVNVLKQHNRLSKPSKDEILK